MERLAIKSELEFERAIGKHGVDLELTQQTPGAFRASMITREVSGNVLYCGSENQSHLIQYSAPQESFVIVSACSPHGAITANGQQLDGDSVFVLPPLQCVDMMVPAETSARTVVVSEQCFYDLAESVSPGLQPFSQAGIVRGDAERRHWLRRHTLRLVQEPFTDPQHVGFDNLIAKWIAWLGEAEAMIGRQSVNHARQAQIARRAQTYFKDNYALPIRLEEVCRELGVSLRTLQRCFANYFQMTPCGYLKILRYNRARRALLEHGLSTRSVTRIATDNGFCHLGRFAAEYRDLFGELPRDTLAFKPFALAARTNRDVGRNQGRQYEAA